MLYFLIAQFIANMYISVVPSHTSNKHYILTLAIIVITLI